MMNDWGDSGNAHRNVPLWIPTTSFIATRFIWQSGTTHTCRKGSRSRRKASEREQRPVRHYSGCWIHLLGLFEEQVAQNTMPNDIPAQNQCATGCDKTVQLCLAYTWVSWTKAVPRRSWHSSPGTWLTAASRCPSSSRSSARLSSALSQALPPKLAEGRKRLWQC